MLETLLRPVVPKLARAVTQTKVATMSYPQYFAVIIMQNIVVFWIRVTPRKIAYYPGGNLPPVWEPLA